jgi:hypothetical protein
LLSLLLSVLALAADPAAGAASAPTPDTVSSTLVVDAKLPAEILIDGHKLGQLWAPARVSFTLPPGDHLLRVYTHGEPHDLPLTLPEGDGLAVVVGRSGLTAEKLPAGDHVASGIVPVEFRVLGGAPAMVRFADARHTIPQGDRLTLDLPVGTHTVSVRSGDGTVIWASGRLTVGGDEKVVVQLAEGRMPEVSGEGRFDASGG